MLNILIFVLSFSLFDFFLTASQRAGRGVLLLWMWSISDVRFFCFLNFFLRVVFASCHKCVCVCCFFTFFNFTRDEEQKTFLLLVRILLLFFHRRHRHHHPRDMLLFDDELCERVLSPRSCSSRFRERRFGQSESEQFNIHEIALAERLLHGLTFL